MKTKIANVLAAVIVVGLGIILFAGCGPIKIPVRTEVFTNEFRVVNFVDTNKVFLETFFERKMLKTTAISRTPLTNGQIVNCEAVVMGMAPGGQVVGIIAYPKR